MRRTTITTAIAVVAATAVIAVASVAAATKTPNNNGAIASRYTVSKVSAKAPISIDVIRGGYYNDITGFGKIPKMKVKVNVPSGGKGLIDVRYSAELQCIGTLDSWCGIYAYVDGHIMSPSSSFGIASTNGGTTSGVDGWIGGGMERTLVVGPGAHTITLKADINSADSFDIDEQSLAVEVFKV